MTSPCFAPSPSRPRRRVISESRRLTRLKSRSWRKPTISGKLITSSSSPSAHLFELFHFQVYEVGALHADPHWGNYLFNEDAGISLVDFGCVKYLSHEAADYLRSVCLYPGSTGSADFRELLEAYYKQAGEKLLPGARRALIG